MARRVLRVETDIILDIDEGVELDHKQIKQFTADVGQSVDAVLAATVDTFQGAHQIQRPDERHTTVHWHESSRTRSCRPCIVHADDEIGG